jgi:hypothetical protein
VAGPVRPLHFKVLCHGDGYSIPDQTGALVSQKFPSLVELLDHYGRLSVQQLGAMSQPPVVLLPFPYL